MREIDNVTCVCVRRLEGIEMMRECEGDRCCDVCMRVNNMCVPIEREKYIVFDVDDDYDDDEIDIHERICE